MDIPDCFLNDWNFSKRSGWMLKVHDKKKLFSMLFLGEMNSESAWQLEIMKELSSLTILN